MQSAPTSASHHIPLPSPVTSSLAASPPGCGRFETYSTFLAFRPPQPQILITQKVISGVYPGVTTVELDTLAAETAASFTVKHPDYAVLAARISVSNLHKQTKKQFSEVMTTLYEYINPKNNKLCPMIADDTYATIMKHKDTLNSAIIYVRQRRPHF